MLPPARKQQRPFPVSGRRSHVSQDMNMAEPVVTDYGLTLPSAPGTGSANRLPYGLSSAAEEVAQQRREPCPAPAVDLANTILASFSAVQIINKANQSPAMEHLSTRAINLLIGPAELDDPVTFGGRLNTRRPKIEFDVEYVCEWLQPIRIPAFFSLQWPRDGELIRGILIWLCYRDIGPGSPLRKVVTKAHSEDARGDAKWIMNQTLLKLCGLGPSGEIVRSSNGKPWVRELLNLAVRVRTLGNDKYHLQDYNAAADLYRSSLTVLSCWDTRHASGQEQSEWKESSLDCFSNFLQVCNVRQEYSRGVEYVPSAIQLTTQDLNRQKRARLMYRCALILNGFHGDGRGDILACLAYHLDPYEEMRKAVILLRNSRTTFVLEPVVPLSSAHSLILDSADTLSEEDCTICLQLLSDSVATTACAHRFHEVCIRQWLTVDKRSSCPKCRGTIT